MDCLNMTFDFPLLGIKFNIYPISCTLKSRASFEVIYFLFICFFPLISTTKLPFRIYLKGYCLFLACALDS